MKTISMFIGYGMSICLLLLGLAMLAFSFYGLYDKTHPVGTYIAIGPFFFAYLPGLTTTYIFQPSRLANSLHSGILMVLNKITAVGFLGFAFILIVISIRNYALQRKDGSTGRPTFELVASAFLCFAMAFIFLFMEHYFVF